MGANYMRAPRQDSARPRGSTTPRVPWGGFLVKIKPLVRVLPAVLMIVVALALSPARSEPITGDGRRATLYLHSTSPLATTETAPTLVDAAAKGPGMDETAPTGVAPKTAI